MKTMNRQIRSAAMRVQRVLARSRDCESGASLLEVTLVLPLALSLMVGTAEFGRGLWAYHEADKSVRAAARYLARVQDQDAITTWAMDKARNLAIKGKLNPADGDDFLVPAWGDTGVITVSQVGTTSGGYVEVQAVVIYPVDLLAVVGLGKTVTYTVSHREPFIGS